MLRTSEHYGPGFVPAAVEAEFAVCFSLLMLKAWGGEPVVSHLSVHPHGILRSAERSSAVGIQWCSVFKSSCFQIQLFQEEKQKKTFKKSDWTIEYFAISLLYLAGQGFAFLGCSESVESFQCPDRLWLSPLYSFPCRAFVCYSSSSGEQWVGCFCGGAVDLFVLTQTHSVKKVGMCVGRQMKAYCF